MVYENVINEPIFVDNFLSKMYFSTKLVLRLSQHNKLMLESFYLQQFCKQMTGSKK